MEEQDDVIPLEIEGTITIYPQSYVNKLNKKIERAKELLTRFIMASVYFNGKEADLVKETEQFLEEVEK